MHPLYDEICAGFQDYLREGLVPPRELALPEAAFRCLMTELRLADGGRIPAITTELRVSIPWHPAGPPLQIVVFLQAEPQDDYDGPQS
jgi:hypothetical protein